MIYIISYDLSEPGQRYEELIGKIKESNAWAKLGESAYMVDSDKTPIELRDDYRTVLDSNDKLYVGRVYAPAAWYGMPNEVSEWILTKLE